MSSSDTRLDVLVIGAGQAGLALGHHLKRLAPQFLLVDGHERVGDSWRQRFDSLVLFTPRAYSALPGLAVPGDPDGYPAKDEIADYLESYADHFSLPLALSTRIDRLEREDGVFKATTATGTVLTAQAVVLATGAFQSPAIPSLSTQFGPEVTQLTPDSYCNPAQLTPGTVLVVGDGATGRQIAREVAEIHPVLLAGGRPRRVSRERILGKSVFWWMDKLGVLRKSRESAVGRYLMRTDPFPGQDLRLPELQRRGVQVVGRLTEVEGNCVTFASGEIARIGSVVWATGYQDQTDWVPIPGVADGRGAFLHDRGRSPIPNLYFIGRSWQWTRGSALLVGVGEDADDIAQQIVVDLKRSSPPTTGRDTTRAPAHAAAL